MDFLNIMFLISGKRICIGDELAKMLLYLFASTILQKYRLSIDSEENVNLDGHCGITLSPESFKIAFKKVQA